MGGGGGLHLDAQCAPRGAHFLENIWSGRITRFSTGCGMRTHFTLPECVMRTHFTSPVCVMRAQRYIAFQKDYRHKSYPKYIR